MMQTCTYGTECAKIAPRVEVMTMIKYFILVNLIIILHLVYFAVGFLYRTTGMHIALQSYFCLGEPSYF